MTMSPNTVVPLRIPNDLLARIRAWAEEQAPATTTQAAMRHLLEQSMSSIERKRASRKDDSK